jgi:uncharacterized protein (TIGR03435 family)
MQRTLPALFLAGSLLAQGPAFETASIKPTPPNPSGAVGSMIGPMPGGGLRAEGMSVKAIIQWAYQVQNYQVTGGPSWTDSDRWTIMARAPEPETPDGPVQWKDMNAQQQERYVDLARQRTQALLTERFHLVLSRENKEGVIYALTVAKNGPKLKEGPSSGIGSGPRSIKSSGANMKLFVSYLAMSVKRPVIDETGLKGIYAFDLKWAPDEPVRTDPNAPPAEAGPSIFTAMEEQLGLRLESRKGPIETLIIQSAEKPEN